MHGTRSQHATKPPGPGFAGSRRFPRTPGFLLPLLLLLAAGCASAPPPAGAPAVDADAVQRDAEQRSLLDYPYRLVFEWEFQEPGVRVRGRGVARVEPPYRARLDLFGPNGDRIAAASLVNDRLEVPVGLATAIPPAPMLWGALGIFRPGPGLYGASATRSASGHSELRFRVDEGGELRVALSGGRIDRIDRTRESGAREELRVRFGASDERFPRESIYRDVGAVRELRITMESVEQVESYPPDVWNPGG
jgi:hypothetical protein